MNNFTLSSSSFFRSKLFEPTLIGLAIIVSYGFHIPSLGFYGDDWARVLTHSDFDITFSLGNFVVGELIQILGANPSIYHFLGCLLLFSTAMLLLKTLRLIEFNKISSLSISLLFVVYPGQAHPAGVLDLIPVYIGIAFAFLSVQQFYFWIIEDSPGNFHSIIGISCATIGLLITPFSATFTGLLIVILLIVNFNRKNEKKYFRLFILTSIIFIIGLFSILISGKNNLHAPSGKEIIQTSLSSFLLTWRQILGVPSSGNETAIYVLIAILGIVSLSWILYQLQQKDLIAVSEVKKDSFIKEVLILLISMGFGILSLFVFSMFLFSGSDPIRVSGSGVIIALFASAVIVSTIKILFLRQFQIPIIAIIIVLSIGARFVLMDRYVIETFRLEDMLSQMAVRMDGFKPGTVLVTEQLPFDFTSRDSIEELINFRFEQNVNQNRMALIYSDQPEVRDFLNSNLSDILLKDGNNETKVTRHNQVGFFYKSGECLQILDTYSDIGPLPRNLQIVAQLSQPSLLIVRNLSDVKQLNWFGTKIESEWCFNNQLIHRMVSEKNWNKIISIYEGIKVHGSISKVQSDYFPIIQAYLHQSVYQTAFDLSGEVIENFGSIDNICKLWSEYKEELTLNMEVVPEIEMYQYKIGCNQR